MKSSCSLERPWLLPNSVGNLFGVQGGDRGMRASGLGSSKHQMFSMIVKVTVRVSAVDPAYWDSIAFVDGTSIFSLEIL